MNFEANSASPLHGGPDALGVPLHDFSTNANACGPCPLALAALAGADRRHYPDPAYTALTAALAQFHAVPVARVVLAASASEFIHRITALAARSGLRQVLLPAHGYGDYARAARLWGLEGQASTGKPLPNGLHGPNDSNGPVLHWACEPASPLGGADAAWPTWDGAAASWRLLDCAYAPLVLQAAWSASGHLPRLPAWRLYSPNKALGLTGVRAAYAIAPEAALADGSAERLRALAPSWPLGADGVALLQAWVQPQAQAWLAQSRLQLRAWKADQQALCQALGWQVLPGSLANFFTARLPQAWHSPPAMAALLAGLRAQGVKLRDCASFGLPGHVRLGVLAPAAQQALALAWQRMG